MFIILIIVMNSLMYTHVKTHKFVHSKYVHYMTDKLYLHKVLKNFKKGENQ